MHKAIIVFCCLVASLALAHGVPPIFDVNEFKKYGPPRIPLLEAVEKAKTVFPEGEMVECLCALGSPANPEGGSGGWMLICSVKNVGKWLVVTTNEVTIISDDISEVGFCLPIPRITFTFKEALRRLSEQTQGVPIAAGVGYDNSCTIIVLSGTNVSEFVVHQYVGGIEKEYVPYKLWDCPPPNKSRLTGTGGDFEKLKHGEKTLSEWVSVLAEDDGVNTNKYNPRQLFSLPPDNDASSLPIVLTLATNDLLSFSIRTELLKAVLFENMTDRGEIDLAPFVPLLEVLLLDDAISEESLSRKLIAFQALRHINVVKTLPLTNAVIRAAQLDYRGKLKEDVGGYFSRLKHCPYVSEVELKSWRKQARPIKKSRR